MPQSLDSTTRESLLINGTWKAGTATFDVVDPATLRVVAEVADGTPEDGLEALAAAHAVNDSWRTTSAEQRATLIRAAAHTIRAEVDSLAALLTSENGKPLGEARGEILGSAKMLDWAAEQGKRADGRVTPSNGAGPGLVLRAPVGPALAITPWNFPASMLARKVGLALAAGCPVIVKPAEQTPLIGMALLRIVDEAGLPPGVVQCITTSRPAELSDAMLADPRLRKVSFTGSTEVGLRLARSTAGQLRRTSLEMGGHSPAIVFDDADIEAAAAGVVAGKFANAGQSCIAVNRAYVHRDVYEKFMRLVTAKVAELRLGRPTEPGTTVGPLIDFDALDKVERQVDDAVKRGASVVAGGGRWVPDDAELKGAFFQPTVLTGVDASMLITSAETFGPVLPVYTFDSDDEAIEQANATEYGLAAYVYSGGFTRVWRSVESLEFGVIGVNEPFPVRSELPFGGMKNSGQEREGGSEGVDAYLETKSVSVRL